METLDKPLDAAGFAPKQAEGVAVRSPPPITISPSSALACQLRGRCAVAGPHVLGGAQREGEARLQGPDGDDCGRGDGFQAKVALPLLPHSSRSRAEGPVRQVHPARGSVQERKAPFRVRPDREVPQWPSLPLPHCSTSPPHPFVAHRLAQEVLLGEGASDQVKAAQKAGGSGLDVIFRKLNELRAEVGLGLDQPCFAKCCVTKTGGGDMAMHGMQI